VFDDGGDVLLTEGLFGLWLLMVGLHLGLCFGGMGKVKLMREILFFFIDKLYCVFWGLFNQSICSIRLGN
jgi:hypothetical protein